MGKELIIDRLVQELKEYANSRSQNVSRGLETPRLAALLLQKYGLGMVDTVSIIYDTPRAADLIYKVMDEETLKIDPQWREHNQERWSGCADISIS